ncbi:MAG TPA: hypothetical protein VNU97_08035 [Rhizomicrobium sp.]|jgi:hypothetical protein|nr:hypothetical protein [Rhizomicrobium sp.]
MRVVAAFAAVLLLSGCTWVRQELATPVAPPPPAAARPEPKPHRPKPPSEKPAALAPQPPAAALPPPPPAPDYGARCRALAGQRADDARQLGAAPADEAKVEADTYRDCMAQSVK